MVDRIPISRAEIHWNQSIDGTPTDEVFVCDRRSRKFGTEDVVYLDQFRYCEGAVSSTWMKGESRMDTPEGVFASPWLTSPERVSFHSLRAALREFAKIDDCEWARRMLAAIEFDPEYGIQGDAE